MKAYCENCLSLQPSSFRPGNDAVTSEAYADLCCDTCGFIVATVQEREAALAQPEQEPVAWNLIDPSGKVVATEKNAIYGWARIGGFKPTVETLLAYHEQGWRVVPATASPQPKPQPERCAHGVWLADHCNKCHTQPVQHHIAAAIRSKDITCKR